MMSNFYKGKKCLISGSEGMIGRELCELLEKEGAELFRFDIKRNWLNSYSEYYCYDCGADYKKKPINITNNQTVEEIMKIFKPDYIFHLFGIKGNPKMTKEKPINFMEPMLKGDVNMICAAQKYGVKRFLYTSSIAVENPETDRFPAWAKMTGETLIEAMRIQHPKGTEYCIVRPSNCFGVESLDRENLMVVSTLLKSALMNKEIILDSDGSEQTRDLIYSKDVARNMMKVMEEMPNFPVNICSGKEVKIKEVAETIANELDIPIKYEKLNMILGPKNKIMMHNYPLDIRYDLDTALKEIIDGIS